MSLRLAVLLAFVLVAGCANVPVQTHHVDVAEASGGDGLDVRKLRFPDATPRGSSDVVVVARNFKPGELVELDVRVSCGGSTAQLWDMAAFGPGATLDRDMTDAELLASAAICVMRLPASRFSLSVNGQNHEFQAEADEPRRVHITFAPGGTVVNRRPGRLPTEPRGDPIRKQYIEDGKTLFTIEVAVANSNQAVGAGLLSVWALDESDTARKLIRNFRFEDSCLPTYPCRRSGVVFALHLATRPRALLFRDELMQRTLQIDLREGDEQATGLVILGSRRIGLLFEHADGEREVINPYD